MTRLDCRKLATVLMMYTLALPLVAAAVETAPLVTYGPDAAAAEGDDDHLQVLLFQVPAEVGEPLFVRIFDADCGGAHDQVGVLPDCSTRFTVLGGAGAAALAAMSTPPTLDDLRAGTVLAQAEVGDDPAKDNEWFALPAIDPGTGDELDGARVFKVLVEGVSGDAGNVYDVVLSKDPGRNVAPAGLRAVALAPTMRLPGVERAVELRLQVPAGTDRLTVASFDGAGAAVTFATGTRDVPVGSSPQGEWHQQVVELEAGEAGQLAALVISGGQEDPNDVTVVVTAGDGRPLPVELPVMVAPPNNRPVPKVATRPLADCYSYVLDGTGTVDPDGDLLQLEWSTGDGTTMRGRQVVHRYSEPGTYRARLMVTDSSDRVGSSALADFTVIVNQPPTSEAGADQVAEPGQPVLLDGSASRDGDGRIVSYEWDLADGTSGEGAKVTHAFAEPGTFVVTLRVKDDSAGPCDFATDYLTVRVNFPPVAEAGEDIICSVGEVITLDGTRSYDTDGRITASEWNIGDGTSGTEPRVEHAYSAPGEYRATLRVTDDAGAENSTAVDSLMVYVNDPPVAAAGADRRLAVGEVSIFDGSASIDRDGKVVYYEWDFGDGNRAKGRVIPYAFSTPGTYEVVLRVRDSSPAASGVDSDNLQVVVNAAPIAAAGPDLRVTSSEVRFDGTTSADPDGDKLSYEWDFGDGSQGSGGAPVHAYSRPGMYRATLRVTDSSGTPLNEAIDRLTVVVNERPVADAGPDQIAAPGEPVLLAGFGSFDPDGEVVAYLWDLGDGSTAEGRSVAHVYTNPGAYTVRLMVRDDTEQETALDFDEAVVRVNAAPTANAGADVLTAPGGEVRLDGSGSFDIDGKVTSFRWRFSDGQGEAATATTTRSFDAPGTYVARLSVVDDSGASNDSAQDELTIRVNAPPRAVPGPTVYTCDSAVTLDGAASVDPDGDGLTYVWDFGDGTTAAGVTVTHVFSEGGSFPVTLSVDDGTGQANSRHSAATTVTINRPPVADAGDEVAVCAGKVALFDGSRSQDPDGGLLRLRWDLGDGTTFEGVHPTTIYAKGGVYTVRLTAEDDSGLECNSDTDQLTVRVAESPVANAGPDFNTCAGARVRFDGTASTDFDGVVNRYAWDFGDGIRGGGATPEHIFVEPGAYRVQLVVTGDQVGSCDNTDGDEAIVTVLPAPVARITCRDAVPAGLEMNFDGSESSGEGANVVAYEWDFGDGTNASGPTVRHAFAAPGRYVTVLTITTDAEVTCSKVGLERTVLVNQAPVAVAGDPRVVGIGEPVLFDGSASQDPDGAVVSYEWDFDDGSTASGVLARHRFAKAGLHRVSLRVTDDAGLENSAVTDVVEVTVNAPPRPVIEVGEPVCPEVEAVLSAASSDDADGEIVRYQWSLGDGQSAEGVEVRHTYQRPGRYEVLLAVDDGRGVANSVQQGARVVQVNHPPRAIAGPDLVVCPGQSATFDGTASADLDGVIRSFRWDFGDGSSAEGVTVTHAFGDPAQHDVVLTVVDDLGGTCGTSTDALKLRVNSRPVAEAGENRQGYTGGAHDAILFDAGSSHDADGDPLTYSWDFGDGAVGRGAKVFHLFERPGTYTVQLTVRDGTMTECGDGTDQVEVTVLAREPGVPLS